MGGAGIVGASRGGMGSQTLLQRIRERDAAGGMAMPRGVSPNADADADGDGSSPTESHESDGDAAGTAVTREEAERILDDICGFLRDRPGRAAPTGLIVDAFGHAVRDKGLFRRLLKQAARLEKGAGTAQWVLRDHFA